MSRTTNILLLMVMLATTQASMDFSIATTWNGSALDHAPVKLVLLGQPDGSLQVRIEAPFFNDPANPGGKPGLPFFGLWEYEVVEAFFLNDNEEYLEVEVCPWGQHIVLMLAGQRDTIRHSLPLEVTTTIDNATDTWSGTATIPADYLPKATTKFNAYAIHGSSENRTYEALYPAPESAANPDFHALQYFQPIDLKSELPSQSTDPMSEFWEDAINGVFPYSITTDWKGDHMDQEPIKITIQGFEAGVELNVSAPFFDDPKPDGPQGAFFGLWDYEVVEMFFLNDNDEYLEVEVGPWGHHILLLLQGERNTIKHSLELDYFAERKENTWSGSAMIPPSYFPPNVTRMNAYAINGVGEKRVYQALYPAPTSSENPDFHRLEMFQPIDFEYQVTDNSKYSDVWEDAIDSATLRVDEGINEKTEAVNDDLTTLGPFLVNEFITEIPTAEEEEVTMLSVLDNSDEKEPEMSSQKVGINQADTKDAEQPEENKVKVSLRPLTRRPSITRSPYRRSTTQRPTQSPEEEEVTMLGVLHKTDEKETEMSSQKVGINQADTKDTEQPEENEANVSIRPLTRRPSITRSPSRIRRPTQRPTQSLEEEEVTILSVLDDTKNTELPEENEVNVSIRPLNRRPSITRSPSRIRRPTQRPTQSLEEEVTMLSVLDKPDEKETEISSQKVGVNQADTKDTEQPEENEVNVSMRPLTRRPSITQTPSRIRPFQRPTQSPIRWKPTRSPARGPTRSPARGPRPQPQPVKIEPQPVKIDNSLRSIQNRRLDDDRGSSGNFLPDQKFPTEVLRPTQFLRPVQRPVPQIVDRPPQEEITFNQEDEKLQIPSEKELQQNNNEQNKDKSDSFDGTDKDSVTVVPGTEENTDIIQQEDNLQSAPLVPLELLPHSVCREAGLIPDQLRCMVFHECVIENGQWQLYSWRCKRGHYYDPHSVSCVRGRCNIG